MNRRALLASLVAGSAGLTGCTDLAGSSVPSPTASPGSGADSTPQTGTGTPASTTARTTQPSVTEVAAVQFAAALRYVEPPDTLAFTTPDRDQFVCVLVRAVPDDDAPPPEAYTLDVGDETLTPETDLPSADLLMPDVGSAYTADHRSGHLVFDADVVVAETATLRQGDVAYSFPPSALDGFASASAFDLGSASVPEAVNPGDEIAVTVEVANRGNRAGTYLAGVQLSGTFSTLNLAVEPGATATGTVQTTDSAEAGRTYRFEFHYPGGTELFEVAVSAE